MTQRNGKSKIKHLDLYGPALSAFGSTLPQFALDQHTADVLISYGEDDDMTAVPMRVFFENAAGPEDVERVALGAGIAFDPCEDIHAHRVASDIELRAALMAAGFDAFAGLSVLENTEPFQVVVFEASRSKPVDLAKAEAEADLISSATQKPRAETVRLRARI